MIVAVVPKNRKNMIVHKLENNLEEVYIRSTRKTARVKYEKGGGRANHGGVGGVLPRGPSLGRPERLEGGENLETGTSRDGHVVSRDGCVVKHALSIIIQIDPLYWMILGRRSAWL